ncbi:MAG: pyruvate, phosphate dikinase [Firmicutes bacterium]|nr:pyruvate, phosphate dikinase [Bacillota bacterium]
MEKKFVYLFEEGSASMKNLLGGKGANLAEMTNLGLPVPPGFIITTEACTDYYEQSEKIADYIVEEIEIAMAKLEEISGKKFGDEVDPLLVSVRSGARASMPGMMDTILNLGLNEASLQGLIERTQNPRFAYDSYRRFIQMFSDVVMEIPKHNFEMVLEKTKEQKGLHFDTELSAEDLREIIDEYKIIYRQASGCDFPSSPKEQLLESVKAVFRSWNNNRAIVYRRMNDIPGNWGTAVNVQMMVFGNMGDTSGTGVAFTRNPATGEKLIFGEYLINAQGEDVVAGIRTPKPISVLEQDMPQIYKQFMEIAHRLETHYKDMQDMEFTIENGKLYFLQTRNGKRTAAAALKIAVDLVDEKMLNEQEAVLKVDPKQLDQLLHPAFDAKVLAKTEVLGSGLPASPGSAAGRLYFTAEAAAFAEKERGERVILARQETSPEDIEGMVAAQGIITSRGGMTSHAAVVARGMGTCCVAGCGEARIDENTKTFSLGGKVFHEGDYISLDGSTGKIYAGDIPTMEPSITGDFGRFMAWADKFRRLKVRTNADTPEDAANAIGFGAEGIGLTRTEHMFFQEDRIFRMRQMILAESEEQRRKALDYLLPMQRKDFSGIYQVMQERPVTVRLLDPPLHEFLPQDDESIAALAQEIGLPFAAVKERCSQLHEFNPMMGHRGLRLAITYPEIAQMQARAIIEAALEVKKNHGYNIVPEIMIPLTCEAKEFRYVRDIVVKVADKLIAESGMELKYLVGTMIEIPRACITADEIAETAEFFSFGTNDLSQMTFGFSRDDAGSFLADYYKKQIFESDPFARLDQKGVGPLMKMAVEKGKSTRPEIKLGICGEHGGDPSSVEFCHHLGLAYVSCSPFRVPIARLAAAQAAIKEEMGI